jgi:hypothetical protein
MPSLEVGVGPAPFQDQVLPFSKTQVGEALRHRAIERIRQGIGCRASKVQHTNAEDALGLLRLRRTQGNDERQQQSQSDEPVHFPSPAQD